MEKYGHKTYFIFVCARDSGAEVSSKNRQDRAGVMAVIQKKKALKLLQRLLYSRLNTQTACRFIEQTQYGQRDLFYSSILNYTLFSLGVHFLKSSH